MGENIQKIIIYVCLLRKREGGREKERDGEQRESEVIKAKEIATLLFLLQPK